MQIRTAKDIVHKLIDVVSKNGQLLLNLSPKADGTFPDDQKQVVYDVGRWLWSFGESIYETRHFEVSNELVDGTMRVHYTRKSKNVYAILLDWPGDNKSVSLAELTKNRLKGKVKAVTLLGLKQMENCAFNQTDNGLMFTIPAKTRVPSEIAHVFRIELE